MSTSASLRLELVENDTIELECNVLDETTVSNVIEADESSLDDFVVVSPTRLRFSIRRFLRLYSRPGAFRSVNRALHEFLIMNDVVSILRRARRSSGGGNGGEEEEEIRWPPKVAEAGFPYQLEDVRRAIVEFQGRLMLASEPGTGKTMMTLAVASHYGGKTLIVCPASLKENWRRECVRWTPERRVKVVRTDADEFDPDSFDVLIVSYTLAGASPLPPTRGRRGAKRRRKPSSPTTDDTPPPRPPRRKRTLENLRSVSWTTMVCDESHNLSNSATETCKNLAPMMKSTPRLVLISGTPMTCRPSQLWVQFSALFANDPLLKSWDERSFQLRYCAAHFNHVLKRWDVRGESRVFELHSLLKTRIVRRFQNEVLGVIPPLTRHEIRLQIAPHEMEEYRLAHEAYEALRREFERERDPARKSILSRRFDPAYAAKYRATCKAKIEAVCAYVIASLVSSNEKILVFAHHVAMIEALETRFRDAGVRFISITGKTPSDRRQPLVDELLANPDVRVGILGIVPGCTGLNITPTVTRVVFAELSFVPSNHLQAEARVHRIGCVHPIRSEYLLAKETMDDELLRALFAKFAVNDSVLDNGRNARDFAMNGTHEIGIHGTILSRYGVRHNARRCRTLPNPFESLQSWIFRVGIPVLPSPELVAEFHPELRSSNEVWNSDSELWANLLERDERDSVSFRGEDDDVEDARSFFWVILGDTDVSEISSIRGLRYPHERMEIVRSKRIVATFVSKSLVSRIPVVDVAE